MRRERVPLSDINKGRIEYFLYGADKGSGNRADRERMKKILYRAIRHELTDRQRECLMLHYIEGMMIKDIAVRLGLSKSTVSRHVSAAERKLRKVASYYSNYH